MKKLILHTVLAAIVLTLTFTVAPAQNKKEKGSKKPESTKKKSIADGEMKTYYMVFLNRGSKRDQDSTTAMQIQKEHLAHLTKMAKEGKMVIAGPFLDEGDTRGICIYSVESLEEARKLAEADPAVKSGRLVVEVRPWMSQKGATLK